MWFNIRSFPFPSSYLWLQREIFRINSTWTVMTTWTPSFLMPSHTQATFLHNIFQHCWIVLCDVVKELAKRAQHLATSKNVATKLWPFLNLIQYHPRCMLQHFATGWPNAWNTSCAIMLQDVVCVWPGIWNVFNKDFLTSVYSWRNLNRKSNHLIKLFANLCVQRSSDRWYQYT